METELHVLALVIIIVATTVSAWIVAFRMRRRMRRALKGRRITDVELTSIATWMDVDHAEKQEQQAISLTTVQEVHRPDRRDAAHSR